MRRTYYHTLQLLCKSQSSSYSSQGRLNRNLPMLHQHSRIRDGRGVAVGMRGSSTYSKNLLGNALDWNSRLQQRAPIQPRLTTSLASSDCQLQQEIDDGQSMLQGNTHAQQWRALQSHMPLRVHYYSVSKQQASRFLLDLSHKPHTLVIRCEMSDVLLLYVWRITLSSRKDVLLSREKK
jgi:hypothetical protein